MNIQRPAIVREFCHVAKVMSLSQIKHSFRYRSGCVCDVTAKKLTRTHHQLSFVCLEYNMIGTTWTVDDPQETANNKKITKTETNDKQGFYVSKVLSAAGNTHVQSNFNFRIFALSHIRRRPLANAV